MKIIKTETGLIKSWCENPEESAIEQAKNLTKLPFIYKHVALMPDTHLGYGMPIGGVIACSHAVIPNAVGVDIGCGMLAVQTNLKEMPQETLKKIMGDIRKLIPVGFNHHKEKQEEDLMPSRSSDIDNSEIVRKEYNSALKQLGTLGSGNHFIEIQKDHLDNIWFMIHSGSRNLGYKVAKYYNDLAKGLNIKYSSEVKKEWDLAFLPIEDACGYINEMNYCLKFALDNRRLMSERIKEAFTNHSEEPLVFAEPINIHHNYAALEHHFGKNVWVHRKGATSAKEGELGIIPGSQGTASYIVKGKGNPQSFTSCSHGAGRKMGRKQAERTLNLKEEQEKLRGIVHSVRTSKDLDEASGAYKDIDTVMAEQEDLVEIITKLRPLGVIKG